MENNEEIDLDDPDIRGKIELLSNNGLDRLTFGAIKINNEGFVLLYNETERRLSGYRKHTIGRAFFTEIAPCMQNAEISGRIEQAREAGKLDVIFNYVSDLPSGERDVSLQIRMLSSADGGTWILIGHEN